MIQQTIAILCGGQSTEHEISLLSASNVIRDIDRQRFAIVIIYITKEGHWLLARDQDSFLREAHAMKINTSTLSPLALQPGVPLKPFFDTQTGQSIAVDCVFPVLHGACGEDGTMQGLLQILNVPFVGCDMLSSAVCMDKHIAKQLLRHIGIATLDWIALHRSEAHLFSYADVSAQLAPVFFMKTVNSGSSLGVYKVRNEAEYQAVLDVIFDLDDNIIIEKAVVARELEISVLGNDTIMTTAPGEVIVFADFYTYEAKYFDDQASKVVTPADVSVVLSTRLQEIGAKAYRALRCKGMARIDFLVVSDDEIYLNEINTLPGFTNISMYPKNWLATGLSYPELLSRLIDAAFEAHKARAKICQGIAHFVDEKREQHSGI